VRVHPRGDPANPEQGVFNTRSPDRPNPVGLHRVTVISIDGLRLRVRDLEALHGRRSSMSSRCSGEPKSAETAAAPMREER